MGRSNRLALNSSSSVTLLDNLTVHFIVFSVFQTTLGNVFAAPAIQTAIDSMNIVDFIPDVMIIITNGNDNDQGSLWPAADRAHLASIDRLVIGVPRHRQQRQYQSHDNGQSRHK